ncbi:hypothetical protein AX16_009668 [Volvariella volvacea WC 439]|nr:hypothetical protein AX16_009668 [Volvariella volvacea WC 439]
MSLRYNIRWVEHTFSSPAAVDSLLGPERDAGTLSDPDYQRARHFLPGPHKYYALIGGGVAAPLVLAARRPSWSNARVYTLLSAASLTGFMVGRALALHAHVKFVRSIQDPAGFSRALENVQNNSGVFVPRGPEIVRQYSESPPEDHEPALDSWVTQSAKPDAKEAPPTKQSASTSRWEEIRAANSPIAKDSSWDRIRQNHERVNLPASPSDSDPNTQRRLEQAEFDAMLERERNRHDHEERF